ncbi:unnamed protein product [Adineta steineri]|uniref:Uncharacterized protein n=1 Tax=Adineta steineri TaxID=433720 RepID=A0A815BEW4_9BILA|nr:unnamed protein product [Adineta steineri]
MPSAVTDVESDWEIFDCPKDPEYSDCKIEIEVYGLDLNMFKLCIHLVNDLSCAKNFGLRLNIAKPSFPSWMRLYPSPVGIRERSSNPRCSSSSYNDLPGWS